jgi:hypothetical protein
MITVIYYTSNKENPNFEDRIKATLLKEIGDLPLISVSQKPIDFGENVCVGDIGASAENILKQMLAGAVTAKTKFIGFGESDCLYHKSYYDFRPSRDDTFYYPDEVYLIWVNRESFWKKRRAELTCIVSREHFIDVVNKVLECEFKKYSIAKFIPKLTKQETFHIGIPVLDVKTKNGLHWKSPHLKIHKRTLPYWGTGKDVWERLCGQ